MAAEPPLSRLVLAATSVADDLGFVALSDLSRLLQTEEPTDYRVIGGHMVTALVARWRLGAQLYRETGDADLGVPPIVVREHRLIERLMELGYEKVAGNRFARTMTDVPVRVTGEREPPRQAVIDVLVPAKTSRARHNRRIGEQLVTTEVLGLATALNRAPVNMALHVQRLNREKLQFELSFPDEDSALVLKALSTQVRKVGTDVVDIWRCLEVAFAANVDPAEFAAGSPADAAAVVRRLFADRHGPGMTSMVDEQRLTTQAADERFTRLRALIGRVLVSGVPRHRL